MNSKTLNFRQIESSRPVLENILRLGSFDDEQWFQFGNESKCGTGRQVPTVEGQALKRVSATSTCANGAVVSKGNFLVQPSYDSGACAANVDAQIEMFHVCRLDPTSNAEHDRPFAVEQPCDITTLSVRQVVQERVRLDESRSPLAQSFQPEEGRAHAQGILSSIRKMLFELVCWQVRVQLNKFAMFFRSPNMLSGNLSVFNHTGIIA